MLRLWFRVLACCAILVPLSSQATVRRAAASEKSHLSPEDVQIAVGALKKEDVAWRKIAWHTCLLDGLKASREQNKPIVLWIFIDRPIDDERC